MGIGIGYGKSFLIPIVAIFVLTIGMISVPQNAYAGINGNGNGNGEDHGKVIEVHCEVGYLWFGEFVRDDEGEGVNLEGERGRSEGECLYEHEDGSLDEIDVFVSGIFILSSLTLTEGGVIDIEGTFHLEDRGKENAIWIEEKGTITIGFCDEDEETEVEGIPFCIETTGFVTDGMGIFEGFTGRFESEGHGYITSFDEREISGITFRTVWIFFEEQPTTPIVQSGGGKGCSGECNPPTMGLNKAGDFRLVDGGFTCNGQTTDVLHFYTPFPKIENKVGEPLRCTFKIYEDSGADQVRHFEFGVGKKLGSVMSEEQGKITWSRTFKGEESVSYDEHLFRDVSFKAMGLTKCKAESTVARCLILSLSATPKEPLVDDIIVMTNMWDHRRNAKQNTHNEGIEFVGNTENTLPFYTVVDGRNGITSIYTTDFSLQDLDHAIDRHGKTWTKINNIWQKDFVMPDLSCTKATYLGYDRYCPEFNVMKQYEADMGKQFFDGSKIKSELTEPFAWEFPDRDRDRLAGTQLG